ncbi:MAG: hypothetical protein ACYTG5_13865 [Planctomycetota bacterium]|jgi:hypothetical protein
MKSFSSTLILCLILPACSMGDGEAEVAPGRTVDRAPLNLSAGTAERFGFRQRNPQAAEQGRALFAFDLPEGWTELPASQFRLINLQAPGDVQCWISTAGGALLANLNRWRGQLGLSEMGQEEVDALPQKDLLGVPALYVELEGELAGGMGQDPTPGAKMLGLVSDMGNGSSLFVKMIGKAEAVDAAKPGFEQLRASLRPGDRAAATGADTGAPPAAPGNGASPITWATPSDWVQIETRDMTLVTFRAKTNPDTECWISHWPGEVGGLQANVARWRRQMGLGPLSPVQVAALPTIDSLGGKGVIVEALPDGDSVEALLALSVFVDGRSTFVKMIGPKNQVEAERENFMSLCKSLKNR